MRPIDAILTDVRLALRSAEALSSPAAFAELVLVASEFEQRQRHLEDAPHLPLLLQLEAGHAALENLRDGNRLRVAPRRALELCVRLHEAGMCREAQCVFDLAEPIGEISAPVRPYSAPETLELLDAWAEVAPMFRPLAQVLDAIQKIRMEERASRGIRGASSEDEPRLRLLYHVGLGLLQAHRWDDVRTVADLLYCDHDEKLEWWFWLEIEAVRGLAGMGEEVPAANLLGAVLARVGGQDLPPEMRTALAEVVLWVLRDEEAARAWLEGVPQPDVVKTVPYRGPYLPHFLQRFRLNRLLHVFGDSTSLSVVVPDEPDSHNQGTVYLERNVCAVARIWGEAWRGRTLEPSVIVRDLVPTIRFFYNLHNNNSFYFVRECRSEFCELLIDAAAQHGAPAIRALRDMLEHEWEQQPARWPAKVRRRIALAFEDAYPHSQWAINQIAALEGNLADGTIPERVAACKEQAAAWLSLGQRASAKLALQAMLRGSFGVAEEKDDQFNLSIDWLDVINESEPDRAPERIAWHCKAIAMMALTTDGGASRTAANNLIAVAHRWSPRRSVALLRWSLDQGLTRYDEAAVALLSASAVVPSTAQPVLSVFSDCAMPFCRETDGTLVKRLLGQFAASGGCDSAYDAAKYMVAKVERYALPSTRSMWRRVIAESLQAVGLDPEPVGLGAETGKLDGTPDDRIKLEMEDGPSLTLGEVISRCATLAGAAQLLAEKGSDSYYHWGEALQGLITTLDASGARTLADLVTSKPHCADVLIGLSDRLLGLGDRQTEWSVALRALGASEPYGWVPRYGPASRLMASKALLDVHPAQAGPLIWHTVVSDITEGRVSAYDIATNLSQILPLLTSDVPTREVCELVDDYCHQLFEACGVADCAVPSFDEEPGRDNAAEAVADLLVYQLGHPVTALRQRAMSACVGLLHKHDAIIQRALAEALETDENLQETILMVLEGAGVQGAGHLGAFRPVIARLLQSDNYGIRASAQALAERLGCAVAPASRGSRPLPAIYRLAIRPDPAENNIGMLPIPLGDVAPDSCEPAEIVRPFDMHLGVLAEACGLQAPNVYYRAVQLMRELAPPQSWTADAERRLRSSLASIGLRYPYPRPRADLARRAMLHIVAELVDAGLLDHRSLRRVAPFLRYFDPYFLTVEPGPKPAAIQPVFADPERRFVDKDWLDRAEEQCGLSRLGPDRFVLAEETTLKRLFWETPTEIRQSVILLQRDSLWLDDQDAPFGRVPNSLVRDYLELQGQEVPMPVVLRHSAFGYDTPGDQWLALNPQLGTMMGWRLSDDGLFRWTDALGMLMVESIWWTEGLPEQPPPHFEDEVGEGWLVVASSEAWGRLRRELGPLAFLHRVKRSLSRDGQEHSRHASRMIDASWSTD